MIWEGEENMPKPVGLSGTRDGRLDYTSVFIQGSFGIRDMALRRF